MAFDTSAAHCAAALLKAGRIVAESHEQMKKGQAERLFPMLEEVLREGGLGWPELDAIGVGVGPGNFTGIRIAVSAARGLALSLSIPAVGVSTFEIVRGELEDRGSDELVSLPGPREQIYVQRFFGTKADAPLLIGLTDEAIAQLRPMHKGAGVVGYAADHIRLVLAGPVVDRETAPAQESAVGEWDTVSWPGILAMLTSKRLHSGAELIAPTPLYVRPPDAAPASDPPPVILP